MFGFYYPDADAVLADPNGRVIVTDGRNHLELTKDRFDIIVTDPPPPIESSGASVISSKEYYEAGRDHLTPNGIMMQWLPYGGTAAEFQDHIRTFAAVFPQVTLVKGAGGYGIYMLGSSSPIAFDEANIREVLARPGVLEDISSAYDSPATTVDEWVDVIARQTWMTDAVARATAGAGPLITDDRPRPEYFLLAQARRGCIGVNGRSAWTPVGRELVRPARRTASRRGTRRAIDFSEIAGRSMRNQLAAAMSKVATPALSASPTGPNRAAPASTSNWVTGKA